jgi:hypothetical protein
MYKPNEKFIVKEEIGLMRLPAFEQWAILEGAVLEIVRVSGEFIYFESQAKEQFSLHHKIFEAHTEPYEPSTKRYSKVVHEKLDFASALVHLSEGKMVTRAIWDGYWKEQLIFTATDGDMVSKKAIVAYLKGGGWAVASPYQEDMLAKDWMVVS